MSARGRAESITAAALDGDASMTDVSSYGEIYRSIDEEGLASDLLVMLRIHRPRSQTARHSVQCPPRVVTTSGKSVAVVLRWQLTQVPVR